MLYKPVKIIVKRTAGIGETVPFSLASKDGRERVCKQS